MNACGWKRYWHKLQRLTYPVGLVVWIGVEEHPQNMEARWGFYRDVFLSKRFLSCACARTSNDLIHDVLGD